MNIDERILPTLPHLRHPVRLKLSGEQQLDWQTVPTKASVEAETSTIINKRLIFDNFILKKVVFSFFSSHSDDGDNVDDNEWFTCL